MTRNVMTALAKQRSFSDEKVRMAAPMDFVTVGTVFAYRRVLPGIRPSFFTMAFKAKLIDRVCPDHFGTESPHSIVALRTANFSLTNWVMGLPVGFRPDIFMAIET